MNKRYRVHFFHPSGGSQTSEVGAEVLVVGRSKGGAQIQLEGDANLSRRHGKLWADGAGLWYQDLGSSNGSFVNGVRLQSPLLLEPGVEVRLGATRLTAEPVPERLQLPPGMELLGESRAGSEGLTTALAGPGGKLDPAVRYIGALYEIVAGLLGAHGLEFIPQALRRLREVVPAAQRISVVEWPPRPDGSFRELVAEQSGEGSAPISMSLARYAVEQGSALLLADSDLPLPMASAPSLIHKGIRSAVYVPLQAEDEPVMGLLCVDSPSPTLPLTSQHFQFICAVAGLLAGTLRAERLREQARHQQLQTQRAEARREGLVSFLKIASHDLKNPLTVIGTVTRILPRVPVEEHEPLLKMIDSSILRATDLIKAYLDVSEVESGQRLQVDWERLEPKALVDQEIAFLQAALQDRMEGIRLVNRVEPGTIQADRRKLGQIMANLVSNAIKYSPAGGEVVIESQPEPGGVRFWVRDQGVGISSQDQKRLFAAFTRVGDRSLAPGTGLGLWLTAALVEAHGGSISLSSTPGQGSSFSFNLPQQPGGLQSTVNSSQSTA